MNQILLIIFIIVMVMWLVGGFYYGDRTPLERGQGLLAWIAVAILGYLQFVR